MRLSEIHKRLRRVAFVTLFAAFCSTLLTASDTWKVALKSPQIFVNYRLIDKNLPRSIVLIGENHASVKTQEQLADLLQKLYGAHGIDAILVEGSYGPIDASSLRSSAGKFRNEKTSDFWRGKLALGQIAGYEYIALTQDGVRVFGVEDMDAKREYTAASAGREVVNDLQQEVELHNRAFESANQASSTLNPGKGEQANAQAELGRYKKQIEAFVSLINTDGPKYAEAEETYSDKIERITALYNKLRAVIPEYERVATEAEKYQRLMEQGNRIASSGSVPPGVDPQKLLAQLNAGRNSFEKASERFDSVAKKSGYTGAKAALDDLKRISEAEESITASQKQLDNLGANFSRQEDLLLDQFFIVTNAIRTAAGQPNLTLQSFLRNEQEQRRTNKQDKEALYLSDRDQHMVSNTMSYLASHPQVQTVALIVGYAHLEGLTDRFAKQQVNILAGKLLTSEDEIEPWESRAWLARSHPADLIFSATNNKRKEQSRLQDETYAQNMTAVLSHLQSVSTTAATGMRLGDTRVFEIRSSTTGTKAIVVTADASELRANWGSYVVDSGIVPDGSGANYLVFDRARAVSEAKKASTTKTLFAPAYQTRTAEGPVTKIDLPSGSVTVGAFKTRPPKAGGASPERVVLAVEGDAQPLNTALGSGGSGEPPWTSPLASFAEPPERRPPSVLFTKNINRARKRLTTLENQESLRIGQIATFEFGLEENRPSALDDLWFTPGRGDHARVLFISGENTQEFRKRLKDAAEARLLENKQIALATCFDPKETDALREMLLDAGAVMVWTPENRISPEAARKLSDYMHKVDTVYGAQAPKTLDKYMNQALALWYKDSPTDPDLQPLLKASRWVELRLVVPVDAATA